MVETEGRDCVVGIDIGGTKIAAAAVDSHGRILLRGEEPSPSEDGERMVGALLDIIDGTVRACAESGLEARAVGVGAAGFVLQEEGLLMESPNIAWSEVPLRRIVGEETGLPSFLDNDASAAALGERFAGVAEGIDDFVLLTLGTGIGGGICVGGKVYRGHRGTASEIGHMLVDPRGPECACGRRGCLESLASGTALTREAARLVEGDAGSRLYQMCGGDTGSITGEMVSVAADEGDEPARRAFKKVAYYLGLGLVSLIHLFDPEMVVLGGGVCASGHLLIDETRRVVSERGIPPLVRDVNIALSTLGTDAGLIGSAAMAWEGIRSLP